MARDFFQGGGSLGVKYLEIYRGEIGGGGKSDFQRGGSPWGEVNLHLI